MHEHLIYISVLPDFKKIVYTFSRKNIQVFREPETLPGVPYMSIGIDVTEFPATVESEIDVYNVFQALQPYTSAVS